MQKFDDNKNIRTYKDSVVFGRLMKYAVKVIWYFVISLLITALLVVVDLLPAYLNGELIGILQDVNISGDAKINSAIKMFVLYMIVLIISAVLGYFNTMLLQKAGQKIVLNLRKDVFVKIENMAISQINATPVGKLVTRVTSDVNTVNELFTNVIINLIKLIR